MANNNSAIGENTGGKTSASPKARRRKRIASPARILKTEAILLRIFPFSRTSHILSWIDSAGRRIVTSVKGATRSKSPFLGQYDLFQTCELLYYEREVDGIHITSECATLRRRDCLRENWRAEHCASWFSALTDVAARSDAPSPALFSLLDETLDVLDASQGAPSPAAFARFEAKILNAAGWRPNFSEASASVVNETTLHFNLFEGRIASEADVAAPVIPVPREAVALFAELLASPSIGPESSFARRSPAATDALLRFLGLFLRHHLPDTPLEGRALALAALKTPMLNGSQQRSD